MSKYQESGCLIPSGSSRSVTAATQTAKAHSNRACFPRQGSRHSSASSMVLAEYDDMIATILYYLHYYITLIIHSKDLLLTVTAGTASHSVLECKENLPLL